MLEAIQHVFVLNNVEGTFWITRPDGMPERHVIAEVADTGSECLGDFALIYEGVVLVFFIKVENLVSWSQIAKTGRFVHPGHFLPPELLSPQEVREPHLAKESRG